MKVLNETAMLDAMAEHTDAIQVEIQPEVGIPGSLKLYVHVNGMTLLRICKIRRDQILTADPFTMEILSA